MRIEVGEGRVTTATLEALFENGTYDETGIGHGTMSVTEIQNTMADHLRRREVEGANIATGTGRIIIGPMATTVAVAAVARAETDAGPHRRITGARRAGT